MQRHHITKIYFWADFKERLADCRRTTEKFVVTKERIHIRHRHSAHWPDKTFCYILVSEHPIPILFKLEHNKKADHSIENIFTLLYFSFSKWKYFEHSIDAQIIFTLKFYQKKDCRLDLFVRRLHWKEKIQYVLWYFM